jgi:hypothetical protein
MQKIKSFLVPLYYGEGSYFIQLPFFLLTRCCLLFILCTGSILPLLAFAPGQTTNQADSLVVRHFQEDNLARYLADEDFRYDRDVRPQAPSLWQRIQQWFFDKLFEALSNEQTRGYWKWGIYIFCGLVIVYVILKLTKTNIRGLFFGAAQSGHLPFSAANENIHAIDFEKQIAEAIAAQQYGNAIRLFYLKTLKQLTDRQLIDWRINKTNQDYLQELGKKEIAPAFRDLTFLFEYIYYGDFRITHTDFEQAQAAFKNFEEQLKRVRANL